MNFGEKIDYLMVKNNIKYATEFAQFVGLSADTINQYRKKENPEGIEAMKIKRLADYFNVSIDFFFDLNSYIEEDVIINDYKYMNNEQKNIDLNTLVLEVISYIKSKNTLVNEKQINEEKKYIIDSLKIGLEILKSKI